MAGSKLVHEEEGAGMAGKVTMQDIADALKLSRNTVSKAVNDTGGLSDATREKVLKKAIELGYKQFSYVKKEDSGEEEKSLPEEMISAKTGTAWENILQKTALPKISESQIFPAPRPHAA